MTHDDNPELDDFLAHYGVKGMRWGVRKKDPAAAAERKTQKAERKQFRSEQNKVLDRRFRGDPYLTKEAYDRLSTRSHTVAKGAELKRIVDGRNKNAADRYVSTNKQDAINYKVGLGVSFLGRGERHEVTLKSVKKLSSPSAKERVDAFVDLMDKPSIELANGKTISGRDVLKKQGYGRDVRRLDSQQLGLKYYNEFLSNQWMDTPINSAYFKEVQKRGYNSLIDDNDAGILAKEPLIILNPSGDVKRMSIKPLTKEEVREAERFFKAP